MPSFKRPCRYCSKLVMPEDVVCPFCGKESPIYIRCPKCQAEVKKDYKTCPSCAQPLQVYCILCNKPTFFDIYCDSCGKKMQVQCPLCHRMQPPAFKKCHYCGKGEMPAVAKPIEQ